MSKPASCRLDWRVKPAIYIPAKTYAKIKEMAEENNFTYATLLTHLMEFYELMHLDIVVSRIRYKYNKGLTAVEISQLSVLYSLLQHIDQKIDLS